MPVVKGMPPPDQGFCKVVFGGGSGAAKPPRTAQTWRVGHSPTDFDLALANPPYYAQQAIAQLFVERAHDLLKPGGRFYLVTKQADPVEPLIRARFGPPVVLERRGYAILTAKRRR